MPSYEDPLALDLGYALERNEFRLVYQPQLDLRTGKLAGVEALLRWEHPVRGVVFPYEIIPLAEETGWIAAISEWVLQTACRQNKAWQEAGLPPLIVSVNLSARQLNYTGLSRTVRRIIEEEDLAPEYLALEITESNMLDIQRALPVLTELKQIGVKLSLDDFGTGYNSFAYLRQLPVDRIKIDKSFISTCTIDEMDADIVKTLIALAHRLNIGVTAEGVVTKEQLIFLQQNLCNQAQGYFFSEPLLPEELAHRIHEIQQVVHRDGIPQELSRQKWLQGALEQARKELQKTVRKQCGMIFKFIRSEGKFIHTFCEGELIYRIGFTPEQVVGKELHEFLPYAEAEQKLPYYQRAWEGEENVIYEAEVNGIGYLVALRPVLRRGQVEEVVATAVEITAKKKAEEALRQFEETFRLIAENTQDVIGVLDPNGIVLYASPAHKKIFGFSPDVYAGRSAQDGVHPEDRARVKIQFASMIASGTPCRMEFRYRHADGMWLDVEAFKTPVMDEQGRVKHVVFVMRDISERKKAEEWIRKSEKMSVVSKLAAGIAHEIRNPLTSIKGFTQLIREEGGNAYYADIILTEIQRLEEVVDGFLTLAKPHDACMKRTDVRTMLQQTLLLFRTQAHMCNIQIEEETSSDLPASIYCDEDQIKQILFNLLQNAIESMPNGGVLRVKAMPYLHDSVLFRVVDQGCGIPKARLKHLGEPFFSTKEKGTGFGLMISQKLAREHGGTIRIRSRVNRGTTVDLILPIIPPNVRSG
jgi:PAS domain S-box-containing protein